MAACSATACFPSSSRGRGREAPARVPPAAVGLRARLFAVRCALRAPAAPGLPCSAFLAGRSHGVGPMSFVLDFLLLAGPAPPDPSPVLKALEAAGRGLKTMKASFAETKVLTLLNEKQETRGSVLLQVPGRLRWDYASPQPGVMMIKDGRFERYVPQTKQVFRGEATG